MPQLAPLGRGEYVVSQVPGKAESLCMKVTIHYDSAN